MNDVGIIEDLRNNLFPGGMGTGIGGLNAYYDVIWPYIATFAGILAVILIGIQVATAFANPTKEMDPYILIKPILIMAAMWCYEPLVSIVLDKPTNLLTDMTEQVALEVTGAVSVGEGGDSAAYDQSFENLYMKQLLGGKDNPDLWDVLSWNPILEIGHILIQIVAMLVALYIMVRQVLLLGVYYILGIFVLPFSLIPGNQEIIKRWFFGFLAVFMWLPVLRILQTIIIIIDFQSQEGGPDAVLASIVLQICAVFFILMTPKFANMLVSGSGDGDSSGWLMFFGRELYYRNRGVGSGTRTRLSGK